MHAVSPRRRHVLFFFLASVHSLGRGLAWRGVARQVGIDVANHVQSFLSKADLGVRMAGGDTAILQEVRSDTRGHDAHGTYIICVVGDALVPSLWAELLVGVVVTAAGGVEDAGEEVRQGVLPVP
jgi:hypothetical protein